MTLTEVLKIYDIEFSNFVFSFTGKEEKHIRKTFLGGEHMESYFDIVKNDPYILTEEVIPMIQYFIDGNIPPMNHNEAELGGIGAFALPYTDAVRFHNPYNGKIEQTIPLEHFKIIATGWRDFLLEPPLNDQIR